MDRTIAKRALRLACALPSIVFPILCEAQDGFTRPPSCPANPAPLTDSGPIVIRENGRVVENLRITSSSGDAIRVEDAVDVVIRNVQVFHSGGVGIRIDSSDRAIIEGVSVVHTGAPPFGENPDTGLNNIYVYDSADVRINHVRLEKGSSGIYLLNSPRTQMHWIEGHDFRGPYPRGQLVQFNASNQGLLEDFSVENPRETSFPEDNINVYHSSDVTIRRGLIDGNNSIHGVAVISEHADGQWSGMVVEDVDAVRMGNGSFFAYPGHNVTFLRVRTRDNICEPQLRRFADGSIEQRGPSSDGLIFGAEPTSTGIRLLDAQYWNACAPKNVVYDKNAYDILDYTEAEFTLKPQVRLQFCWQTSELPARPAAPDQLGAK